MKEGGKGDDDGTQVYEFQVEQGAKKFEVSITAKGAFFGTEEEIKLADVPDKARATINKTATGGKIVSVEKALDKNKKTTYEALIEKGGKQVGRVRRSIRPGKGRRLGSGPESRRMAAAVSSVW